ncbi:MAG: phenylalanine--tRNA ligase subunit alpha [Rhodanobacteraceae bacterium]|nr:phenylalanine--tRNA ligase subunit alpha [Rhodanobacteraceae bacterium]
MSLDQLLSGAQARIESAADLAALDALRVELLGKSGSVTAMLKTLGSLSPEERKTRGAEVNRVRDAISEALNQRKSALDQVALAAKLERERIDISLPGRQIGLGGLHPITRALDRIVGIFERLGYTVADGPEIESDWYNFEALNFPPDHPARTMHDTFYFPDGRLLRTHTSPVQIRVMQQQQPPIRVIMPGKVYRSDSDQTHSPMFHQVEGLVVGEDINFADLKGTLLNFVRAYFEREPKLLFRPSYFPFTEPSADVLMNWELPDGSERWLEVLGCGMVHPNVLRNCGIDAERYTGFAFGLGVERFAMLRYGVTDLRAFYENDLRFLGQFA